MIYSIGYQGMSVDRLLQIMKELDIEQVIDIRTKPWSRVSEWSQGLLKKRLGSRYIWKGDSLGGLEGPVTDEGLRYLIGKSETVVLLCMEHDPRNCHRHKDIAQRLKAAGIEIIHIIDMVTKSDQIGGPHGNAIGIPDSDL